jgi:hypothetical protein
VAVLVLASQGRVQYDHWVFANVGDDSENPGTLAYLRDVARPFARRHGIELVTVGRRQSLYTDIVGNNRSVRIPAYMANGAPGNRACTAEWKIQIVWRHLRGLGASKTSPATVGLGISTDEIARARTDSGIPGEVLEYPLIDLGLSRRDCVRLIGEAGLSTPPKSSCWFCPYHRPSYWIDLRRDNPELWARAVALEARINEKRGAIGRDVVYLHPSCVPLEQAVALQPRLFADDVCEFGYCGV